MKTRSILIAITLMFTFGTWTAAAKGGKGGGKPGGGGGGSCAVDDNWSGIFDSATSFSDGATTNLGFEMAAIDWGGDDILLVATADVGVDGDSGHKSIEVFSFSVPAATLTHINSVSYPAEFGAYQKLLLAYIDNDLHLDLLLGSNRVNRVRFYSDIAGDSFLGTMFADIPTPSVGDTSGDGFGEGLAFGDFVSNLPGNEIAIGAGAYFELEGRVFIYSAADLSPLGVLSSPEPTGSDQFGVDLAVGPLGLYVAAKWADVGKKRKAGKVFLFGDGLDCSDITSTCESAGGAPVKVYARGNRNENLGRHIAATSEGDLAATGADEIVLFKDDEDETVFDLPMPGDGLIQHLASADINFWGPDDLLSARPNTDADSGNCYNVGSAFVYLDPSDSGQEPVTLRSPNPMIDDNNLMFGWGAAAASGTVFVSERGRDINADGNREGVIYAFTIRQ